MISLSDDSETILVLLDSGTYFTCNYKVGNTDFFTSMIRSLSKSISRYLLLRGLDYKNTLKKLTRFLTLTSNAKMVIPSRFPNYAYY